MPDPITLTCGACGQRLRVPADHATLAVTCPRCRRGWDWSPTPLDRLLAEVDGLPESPHPDVLGVTDMVAVPGGARVWLPGVYGGVTVQPGGVAYLDGVVFGAAENRGGVLLVRGTAQVGKLAGSGGLTGLVCGARVGNATGTVTIACLGCGHRSALGLGNWDALVTTEGIAWCRACHERRARASADRAAEAFARDPEAFLGPVPDQPRKKPWWRFW